MVRNDLGYKKQNMGGEKVLFHKVIFHSYEEAINILKSRNLAPGEMAVARYYIGYDDTTIPPSWDYIRMVLAIGGATPNSNEDVYFFKDFTNNGEESITFDDLEEKLSNYYTKEEIAKILNDDSAWKQLVNQRLDNIDNDIDKLREDIGSGGTSDLENYYTKTQVDELLSEKLESNDVSIYAKYSDVYTRAEVEDKIDSIEIPDVSNFVTNEDLNKVNNKLDEKVDKTTYADEMSKKASVDSIEEINKTLDEKADSSVVDGINASIGIIESELTNKVDSSYVEEYFTNNVKDTVENAIQSADIPNIVEEEIGKQDIAQQVNDAVDRKLEGFEGVTTETLDDVLQNDEYFNTTVITPISTIETQIKEIQTQIKNLAADIDGGEEEEWVI